MASERIPHSAQMVIFQMVIDLAKAHDTTLGDILARYGLTLEVAKVPEARDVS